MPVLTSPLSESAQRTVVDAVEPTTEPAEPSRPRRWPLVAGAAVVGLAIAGVAIWQVNGDDANVESVAGPTTDGRIVSAEQRDLVEFTDLDGRLIAADSTSVTAAVDGVATAVATDGDALARGDVLYAVNDQPVSVIYGDTPLYRELTQGIEGDDVLMLEQNLASLGHHTEEDEDGEPIDTGFLVDGVYDIETTAAVWRWQADLGRTVTGTVAPGDVVVVEGPVTVSNVGLAVGDRVGVGTPVADLDVAGTVTAAYAEHGGEVDLLVGPDTELTTGTLLYTVDDVPVIVIASDESFTRDLTDGIDPGEDVRVVEEMLAALGFGDPIEFDVDDTFDVYTEEAIEDLEETLQDTYENVEIDGELGLEEFVVVEPGTVVGTPTPAGTDTISSGTELWSALEVASATRVVETAVEVNDQERFAIGSAVDVEFPDGSTVTGTVLTLATRSTVDPTDPDAEPTLAVEIELASIPASAEGLTELDVDVKVVDELVAGATAVPVSALVSVGDGTYVVEAVTTTGSTVQVPVVPGMFSDGWVEVDGIDPGTQVVVPS